MGFSEAEDNVSTQDFNLTPQECNVGSDKNHVVPTKFVKFQNVTSMQIFVKENFGQEDVTELKYLELFGYTGESSDIKNWAPCKS